MRKSYYLSHYGVQGMRWGVRRYQRPDGSLTTEGRKRYSEENLKRTKKVAKYYAAMAASAVAARAASAATQAAIPKVVKHIITHPKKLLKYATWDRIKNMPERKKLMKMAFNAVDIGSTAIAAVSVVAATAAVAKYYHDKKKMEEDS